MDFQINKESGNWLTQLNGKTVDKIFQVDYNNNRKKDIYLPWLFFITFLDFDKFLEIEGDFDGDHIRINLYNKFDLNKKLKENNLTDEPDLWSVYETKKDEVLGKLLGEQIGFLEYGIEKDELETNGTKVKRPNDIFNFIRFNSKQHSLTIFEGSAAGLAVSDDKNVQLSFEDTFDKYDTK